jgi:hypothetical protein
MVWKAFKHWRHGEKPVAAVAEALTRVDPPPEDPPAAADRPVSTSATSAPPR